MLSLERVLLTAIASLLVFAISAGIFADLLLSIFGPAGMSFDMYRIQIRLTFLYSVMGTYTYTIIRRIYEFSLDFSRWKNKDKMPFQYDMKTLLFFHVQS